ncbi:unnamed protein product, partial [Rotaria socialis]
DLDDVNKVGEEIIVGVGFSSSTDSLGCFSALMIVEMMNKVKNIVVAAVVDELIHVDSMIDIGVVDQNFVVENDDVMS